MTARKFSSLIMILCAGLAPVGAAWAETDFSGMALIPAGSFFMGSSASGGDPDERPRHKVYLDAFYIDKYPVTLSRFLDFCRASDRTLPRQLASFANLPVVNVTWDEAKDFCEWNGRRLPTEAEWEKAARGGTDAAYSFGDDAKLLGKFAWYSGNSRSGPHAVGLKLPNRYGLYDAEGNVQEWVFDAYDADFYKRGKPSNPVNETGLRTRVTRGSADNLPAEFHKPARRFGFDQSTRLVNMGFRCAADAAAAQP